MSLDDVVVAAEAPTVSPARVRANQRNAQLSTGPKTPRGKARSRENGLKHGLSGAGIVMPPEMREEVDRLIARYTEQFQPATNRERDLIEERALGLMRTRVAWNTETFFGLNWSDRAQCPNMWDADRRADAEDLGARLAKRPGVVVARLEGTLHGARWLRERWLYLDETVDQNGTWDESQRLLAARLLGVPEEFLERDPMKMSTWTAAEMKETSRNQIERLETIETDELIDDDESRRQMGVAGMGHYDSPAFLRLSRYYYQAHRQFERADQELERIRKRREQGKGPSKPAYDPVVDDDAEPTTPKEQLAEAKDRAKWKPRPAPESAPPLRIMAPYAPPTPGPVVEVPKSPKPVAAPVPPASATPKTNPEPTRDVARAREAAEKRAKRRSERKSRKRNRA